METWKDIPGYEGIYQASGQGRIKRIKRYRNTPGVLSAHVAKSGYVMLSLWKNNKGLSHYVHRLVCAAFHGAPAPGLWCNHKDGNRLNNCADNLEWMTPLENERHAIANLGKSNAGERNGRAKLTDRNVISIRSLYQTGKLTHQEIADMFGVSRRNVGNIINKKLWRHI